ncbi:MAG: DUF1292 domain-containing protein [Lachnospiraceae bacterium]|nr:DUF1292 domain-containing protein [Lachnospiraceae bacterium]
MNENARLSFTTEDGDTIELEVLEQTTIAGQNYILVADTVPDEEDTQVYIMKEVADASQEDMVSYEFVEEEQELLSISKVFEELLEDTDIVKQDF